MTDRRGDPARTPAERLGHPDLAPLVDELVRRYSSGHDPVRITLPAALGDAGLGRLADLLGLDRLPVRGRAIAVDRLATGVGADDSDGLRATVVELRGPLGDRRAERASDHKARVALWDDTEAAASGLDLFTEPDAAAKWVRRLTEAGVPGGDLVAHRQRIETALACLRRLPAAEPLTLAGLAVDETGSAHGLDPGRRISRAVLEGLAVAFDLATPSDAESVRALWEQAGVVPDPVSSSVLTLGLRPGGDDPLAVFLRAASTEGEAVVLTLRQLQRRPLIDVPARGLGYLVENPSLISQVAGAWDGPPLLCSSGQPSVAVVVLVRQLVEAGTMVRQHADFDAAGVGITRWLMERAGTVPWRMTAEDYRAAVACRPSTPLNGEVGPTPWDLDLAPAMRTSGLAVHEEAIRLELLDEIGQSTGS